MSAHTRPTDAALEPLLKEWSPEAELPATHRALTELVTRAHTAIQEAGVDQRDALRQRWRDRFHPYFMQAPNLRRAFEKPLGYAGDHVIMDMGYRNCAEGETPLGKMLHQWFSGAHRACAAVRSRRRRILQEMERHGQHPSGAEYRIMSLASGSAWELRDLVGESYLVDRVSFRCVDQDPTALSAAERGFEVACAEHQRRCRATFAQDSVRSLMKSGAAAHGKQDFIYSLGLYDYLPAQAASRLTQVLYDALAPGGRLVLANYMPSSDARPIIELVSDWWLIYRDREEMLALGKDLPSDASCRVEADVTGSIWLLFVDKPEAEP
jgi:SAM-dependent methyltransferase